MAIKKSQLYSSIWKSCDELRGGMDASQYKDYVLVLLFIKYISDKYAGVKYAPITVPKGASFKDMVELKGKPTIGDDINKKIIARIAEANKLTGVIDVADFANPEKLGKGKDMVDRLTKLIAIFENPELDFSKNHADGDDILGDAYEYLMRNFATESGKSKGQFYTPAEVSRIMAKIIGINSKNANSQTTAYDPTCGSGSLLLKVADEAETQISLFGQEMDTATAALAQMNMILHNYPSAKIARGNSTLSSPDFKDKNGRLRTFSFAVSNPPFSFKAWSTGVNIQNDEFERFKEYGIPPSKNGDFAFLLHIIHSLNSKGKGAVILPHGVLFRGNAEAEIRKNIIRKGYIKGVIGLPANLFYGTGIPACIIVLDKENADNRKGIFMIDASKGFVKDGNKNRLREQDIHKIVDVFNKKLELEKYSRIVSHTEIESNEFNLNIPRYIDSQEPEDIQDIEAHLLGDIPNADIDALNAYWQVYPSLKKKLFSASDRKQYSSLKVEHDKIKTTIFSHPEFIAYTQQINTVFTKWKKKTIPQLQAIRVGDKPKKIIHAISEELLQTFSKFRLIDKYDMYQHLMAYWIEVMRDDVYVLVTDGWKAGNCVERKTKELKDNKRRVIEGIEGIEGRLISPELLIAKYFAAEKKAIEGLKQEQEAIQQEMEDLEEEYSGDEDLLGEAKSDTGRVIKPLLIKRIKDLARGQIQEPVRIAAEPEVVYGNKSISNCVEDDELIVLKKHLQLIEKDAETSGTIKVMEAVLENNVWDKYGTLTINEIKTIVVEEKWIAIINAAVQGELQRISQRLTLRIEELAERYAAPLPQLTDEVTELEKKVNAHLQQMGFVWK